MISLHTTIILCTVAICATLVLCRWPKLVATALALAALLLLLRA